MIFEATQLLSSRINLLKIKTAQYHMPKLTNWEQIMYTYNLLVKDISYYLLMSVSYAYVLGCLHASLVIRGTIRLDIYAWYRSNNIARH